MVGSGNFCAVAGCLNSWRKGKKDGKSFSFHSFPKRALLRKTWIKFCCRKKVNPNSARICSEHFHVDDYQLNFRMELMGIPSKRMLIPDALPTLNPPVEKESETFEKAQTVRTPPKGLSSKRFVESSETGEEIVNNVKISFQSILAQRNALEMRNKRQREEIDDLKTTIDEKNSEINSLHKKLGTISSTPSENTNEKDQVENFNIFSPNELRILKGL